MAFLLTTAQASYQALTFHVDSTLEEPDASPGDGNCVSTPSGLCTLRAAVQEVNALVGADTIALPAGSHRLTLPRRGEDLAATSDLDLRESVTLQGTGASSTVIDANAIDRAFQVFSPAVVTLSDLTVRGGDTGGGLGASGGGIALASGSQLTLEDATLSGNSAGDSGGGIYNNGGALVLVRARVVANTAATAAGIRSAGSLSITDSTIAGNHATGTGGGILNTGALTLERATISSNVADTNGGGLYLHSADPATGLVSIQNSTISGNQAKAFMGGGIWVYYQTELWLTRSTLANNSAGQGGGIFNYHQQDALATGQRIGPNHVAQEGNVHLQNTIVADNTLANCGRNAQTAPIHSLGHNLDSGESCEFNQSTDLRNADPKLGALADNGGPTLTRALLPGSPAIDAGDNTSCPSTDQRGVPRPQGDACDIGAYELGETVDLSVGKTRQGSGIVTAGERITYTIAITNHGPTTPVTATIVDTWTPTSAVVEADAPGCAIDLGGGLITCTHTNLALGPAFVPGPYVVMTNNAAYSGTLTNLARVAPAGWVADTNPANDESTPFIVTIVSEYSHGQYLPLVLK